MSATPHPSGPESDDHLFDQTNGVLGPDTDDADRPAGDSGSDTSRFGIPPIVSL